MKDVSEEISEVRATKDLVTAQSHGDQDRFWEDQATETRLLINRWLAGEPSHVISLFNVLVSQQVLNELVRTHDERGARAFRGVTILFPSAFALCRFFTTGVTEPDEAPVFLLLRFNDLARYQANMPITTPALHAFSRQRLTVVFVATKGPHLGHENQMHIYSATGIRLDLGYIGLWEEYQEKRKHLSLDARPCVTCHHPDATLVCTICRKVAYCDRVCMSVHSFLHERVCMPSSTKRLRLMQKHMANKTLVTYHDNQQKGAR